jgi:hypothetical protein
LVKAAEQNGEPQKGKSGSEIAFLYFV